MQKFLGGLSHTSNYASSPPTAIGLARKCPDAGDRNEAKQIEMDRRAREGRRALGSRVSAWGQSLVKTGSCDGWDGTQAHGGVMQRRWGVHRLQVLGATRYVPCPGGTWVPRLCSHYPCLALSGFFWVGVGRGWAVGRSMSHDKVRAHLNLGQTPATTTSLRTAHRASPVAPRLQSTSVQN